MKCSMCKNEKVSNEFVGGMYKSSQNGGYSRCLSCHRNYTKQIAQWRKLLVLSHYSPGGPVCACNGCEERNIEFLVIDHIDGGGNLHRKQIKNKSIYLWLKKNHYPSGFRVLCWNCNNSRGSFGYCPHEVPSRFSKDILMEFGQNQKGEARPNSKLTAEDVVKIKDMLKTGISQQEIAGLFRVNRSLIGGIGRGERWIHVSPTEISPSGADLVTADQLPEKTLAASTREGSAAIASLLK